jgi:GNAT superfamily N-acetyltransferase
MSFLIRPGEIKDMTAVVDLFKELAIIKKQPNAVKITNYDLINDGFSSNHMFKTYVAVKDDEIIGVALFYKSYSTSGRSLILEDVYVNKANKNKGIGLSLFAKFLEIAKTNDIHRLEWGLLEEFTDLMELYKRAGAKVLSDVNVFIMDEKAIEDVLKNKNSESKSNALIRKGEMRDMADVLDLMKELAVYKKCTSEIDVYDLMKDGFSKQPFFKTLVAEIDGEIVGMALFYHTYSSFLGRALILEGVYLFENYRAKGIGTDLVMEFFRYAKNNGIKRIEQAIFEWDKKANERVINFGYKKVEGLKIIRIGYNELNNFINKN